MLIYKNKKKLKLHFNKITRLFGSTLKFKKHSSAQSTEKRVNVTVRSVGYSNCGQVTNLLLNKHQFPHFPNKDITVLFPSSSNSILSIEWGSNQRIRIQGFAQHLAHRVYFCYPNASKMTGKQQVDIQKMADSQEKMSCTFLSPNTDRVTKQGGVDTRIKAYCLSKVPRDRAAQIRQQLENKTAQFSILKQNWLFFSFKMSKENQKLALKKYIQSAGVSKLNIRLKTTATR